MVGIAAHFGAAELFDCVVLRWFIDPGRLAA